MTKPEDEYHGDLNIENGKARVDGSVYYIHFGCPEGNSSVAEKAMSAEYYNGQPIHLEGGRVGKGQLIPLKQLCTECGTENGLVFFGMEIV